MEIVVKPRDRLNSILLDIEAGKTEIDGSYVQWTNTALRELRTVLFSNKNKPNQVRSLKLFACNICDGGAKQLCYWVNNTHKIEILRLADGEITDIGVEYLCKFLTSTSLKELHLGGHDIRTLGCTYISRTLLNLDFQSNLESLDLSTNPLRNEGACDLFEALFKKCPNLQKLSLNGVGVTDSGCQVLASHFPTKLQELYLGANAISDVGCIALINCIGKNLKTLSLFDNKIKTEGLEAIGNFLVQSERCGLIQLFLDDNRFGDEGVTLLANKLQESGDDSLLLQELSLSTNSLTDVSGVLLAKSIGMHLKSLRKLFLLDNKFTSVTFAMLDEICQKTYLQELWLNGNECWGSSTFSLKTLCYNTVLHSLGWSSFDALKYNRFMKADNTQITFSLISAALIERVGKNSLLYLLPADVISALCFFLFQRVSIFTKARYWSYLEYD